MAGQRSFNSPIEVVANNRYAICLAAISLLTLVLRLYHLGLDSLWLDESFSIVLSQNSLTGIIALASEDVHPPLYYLLLHFFLSLPGQIELVARMPSVIFGVLAIFPLYFLAKDLFGKNVGIVASLLYAVSFAGITYSQEARMYTMMVFLGAIQMYYFYRSIKRDQLADWAVFAISSVLIVYTHYYGFLLTGTLALYGLAISFRTKSKDALNTAAFRHLLIIMALIFLAFLPQLPVAYHQSQSSMVASQLQTDNLMFFPKLAYFLTACGIKNPRTILTVAFTAAYMALSAAGIVLAWRKKSRELSYLLTILIIASMATLLLSNFTRFCGFRYILFLIVPYLALVSNGIVSLAEHAGNARYRVMTLAGMIALILLAVAFSITPLYSGTNVDIRGAMQYVKDHSSSGDKVVVFNSDSISPGLYAGLLGIQDMVEKNSSYDDIISDDSGIVWAIVSDIRDNPGNEDVLPLLNEHMQLRATVSRASVYYRPT
ncbi:glycosyltransferase family 39 protein [Methanocella paludicola]|nr:glycosyltransferase family 39 protein [Methanocella paludicola]